MTGRSKTFEAIRQLYHSAFIIFLHYSSFMNRTDGKGIFQAVPWIFFNLLVTQLQFASFFINAQDDYIYFVAYLSVFVRVIEAFQPAKVADVNHTANTGSQFYKHTIRSDVFNYTFVLAAFGEAGFNGAPWVFCQLFDRKTHFAGFFIECYYFGFVFIAQFKELFSIDRSVSPCNFTYVNQTFYTRHNFKECTVVFDIYYFAFYHITFFKVFGKRIPWMRSQLFQAKADAFFIIIKVKYYNIYFLIQFQYFARMVDTAP